MSDLMIVSSILGALAVGAVSPGPSFLLVTRISLSASRTSGLCAAVGMGVGGAAFGSLALVGLVTLLAKVPWLYAGLKVIGGLYLLWLALRVWRSAAAGTTDPALPRNGRLSPARALVVAMATQLSNPKAAVVYASIFAALLPPHPSAGMMVALPPLIFCLEAGWYAVVVVVFSSARPRSVYLGAKRWIDRAAGAVMGGLGISLIAEAVRPD